MRYRVIQWATGNVGRAAVEGILAHPELELAGACVTNEAKPLLASAAAIITAGPAPTVGVAFWKITRYDAATMNT